MSLPVDKYTPKYDAEDDLSWLLLDQRAKSKKGSRKMSEEIGNPNPVLKAEISKYRTGDIILLLEGWKEEMVHIKAPESLDGPIIEYDKSFRTPITRKVVFLDFDWEHERIRYQTEAGDSVGSAPANTVWKKVGKQIGVDVDEDLHKGGDGGDEEAKAKADPIYPNVVGKIFIGTQGSWNRFKFKVLSQSGEKLRVIVLEGPIAKQNGMEFGLRRSTFDTCIEVKEVTE